MTVASRAFGADTFVSARRQEMVRAARALLSAVTRLLIVADMIDVQLLIRHVHTAQQGLDGVKVAGNQEELMSRLGQLRSHIDRVSAEAGKRANDLLDPSERDNLQAARALLKTNSPMLYTSSKVY